ncbi:MAG TPA: amino acid ABC transporter permease [Stellaceae bacterium]|nr:amino acid ABC transporter permease [Stellaceae bacterium]
MPKLRAFLKSCVSTPLNIALSLAVLAGLAAFLPSFIQWAFIDAVWSGPSGQACAGTRAACWLFVRLHWNLIVFGRYPAPEHWRVELAAVLGLASVLVILLPTVKRKLELAAALLVLYPVAAAILLCGGIFGLTSVSTSVWGGLLLTVVVAAWTIVTAIPLGLMLALGRRSRLPVIALLSARYIDVVRGLPLVGVLFLAVVLLPVFMPPSTTSNTLVSALIAFSLFNAAILAEVFRGGLQSVPRHQYEGGAALGFSHRQVMWLIVIPRAISAALPGIVNVCVEIVKETTLILIVGLLDLLGVLQAAITDPEWLVSDQVRRTAYFFAGIAFWALCFSLSRYSARIERGMNAGTRR